MADTKSDRERLVDLIDERVEAKTAEVQKKYSEIHKAPEPSYSAKDAGLTEQQSFGRALTLLVKSGGNYEKAFETIKAYNSPISKAIQHSLENMSMKAQNATVPSDMTADQTEVPTYASSRSSRS